MNWIKIKEKLPEKMGYYLIYGRYAKDTPMNVFQSFYSPKDRSFRTDIKSKDVTHWMELPKPPEYEK